MIRFTLLLSLLFAFVADTTTTWATSFYPQPFPDTVQETPVIVRGKVGSSYPEWGRGSDGTRRIYTYYELQLDEALKGSVKGPSLLMRELGGEKDGLGMQVAGAAHFERGEDVVAMLGEKNSDGSYDIQGLMMGKLNVRQDESGKEVLEGPAVDPSTMDAHLHVEGGQADTPSDKKWTLQRLRKLVADQAQGLKGEAPSQNPSPNPSVSASVTSPSPAPSGAPTPAPQLQPSTSTGAADTTSDGPGNLGWILGGIALVLAGVVIWRATRNRT